MPRANRFYQVGHLYHITHRCNEKKFLLNRRYEKRCYRYWLYQAVKRYGLIVLNYTVTSNHIHLLIKDSGDGVIASSMRLIASRVAQEYNNRTFRAGAFWQGRYYATLIDNNKYLIQCMVYIDLNMVRAGVISHPKDWRYSGYYESIKPRTRYVIINKKELLSLFNINSYSQLNNLRNNLIHKSISENLLKREPCWTESISFQDLI